MAIEDDIAAHDEREDGVYLIQVFNKEVFIQHAIFSLFEKAQEWMRGQPNEYTCMCAPFIVDSPDAGKREKEELQ